MQLRAKGRQNRSQGYPLLILSWKLNNDHQMNEGKWRGPNSQNTQLLTAETYYLQWNLYLKGQSSFTLKTSMHLKIRSDNAQKGKRYTGYFGWVGCNTFFFFHFFFPVSFPVPLSVYKRNYLYNFRWIKVEGEYPHLQSNFLWHYQTWFPSSGTEVYMDYFVCFI